MWAGGGGGGREDLERAIDMIGMVIQMPQFSSKALEVDIAQDSVRLTHFI